MYIIIYKDNYYTSTKKKCKCFYLLKNLEYDLDENMLLLRINHLSLKLCCLSLSVNEMIIINLSIFQHILFKCITK